MRPLHADEAAARAALVSDVATEVTLDLRAEDHARVRTRLTFASPALGVTTFLDAGFDVVSISCNGTVLDPATAVADGRIALPPLAGINEVEVEGVVRFRRDGQGLHRFVDPADGRPYLHTKFQPFDAHHVYACFDQPDVKGPVTTTVVTPAGWQVVANGRVTATTEDAAGAVTRRFATTPPLPAYLVAVVAGPYAEVRRTVDGLDIGLWARPALAERLDVDELVEITAAGRRWYEDLFGIAYPFGDHYDTVFVPEYGFGAMEHPGCVTAHERFVFRSPPTVEQRRRRSEVLLHEMAHMWFGNLVTMRWWDDLWLNESFATLLASLAQSEATPTGAATWAVFAADAKVRARDADRLPTTHPVHGHVSDTDAVRSAFDAITYRKGAAMLAQRLRETGRVPFITGLSGYLREHAGGNATAADLHRALGPVGGRDGEAWAADWLGTTGAPALVVERVADGWDLRLEAPAGRRIPSLAVTVARLAGRDGAVVTTETVEVELADDRPVRLPAKDDDLVLVPNADDGYYATVVLGGGLPARLAPHLGAVADPVVRAVLWSAWWEAVIDGRLAPVDYIAAVVAHGLAEAVPGVRQVVVERAVEAAWYAGNPGGTDGARGRLSRWAARAVDLPTGSDEQRLLASALAATAAGGGPDVEALAALALRYAATEELRGAFRELRWELLAGLCRVGAAGEDDVAALAAEDTSDISRRGALRARAAMPTTAAREAAWTRATGPGLSLAERQAVLDGWAAPGRPDLAAPFEERFFAALGPVEAASGVESALALARTAFPRWPTDPAATIATAEGLAAGDALAAPVRRALVEQAALLMRRRRAVTVPPLPTATP